MSSFCPFELDKRWKCLPFSIPFNNNSESHGGYTNRLDTCRMVGCHATLVSCLPFWVVHRKVRFIEMVVTFEYACHLTRMVAIFNRNAFSSQMSDKYLIGQTGTAKWKTNNIIHLYDAHICEIVRKSKSMKRKRHAHTVSGLIDRDFGRSFLLTLRCDKQEMYSLTWGYHVRYDSTKNSATVTLDSPF